MIGLLGGLGPESTIDYYRRLVDGYRERHAGESPPLLITSLDVRKLFAFIGSRDCVGLIDYLAPEFDRLAEGGATVGAITANTPHNVFDEVCARSPIPLVSIVEAACGAARGMAVKRLVLLGTDFTMTGRFYPNVFEAAGMSLVVPSPQEREYIHEKYVTELLAGLFVAKTRQRFIEIISRLQQEEKAEAVILAGTELPLLFGAGRNLAIPILNTAEIHVQAILAAYEATTEPGTM